MIDVTESLRNWMSCSNRLWREYFIHKDNASDRFVPIESALFEALVIRDLEEIRFSTFSSASVFDHLRVEYLIDVDGTRQLCVIQKAGNVFCKQEAVSISRGSIYKIKSVDTMGTMLDGNPYAEIIFPGGYILETPRILRFFLDID